MSSNIIGNLFPDMSDMLHYQDYLYEWILMDEDSSRIPITEAQWNDLVLIMETRKPVSTSMTTNMLRQANKTVSTSNDAGYYRIDNGQLYPISREDYERAEAIGAENIAKARPKKDKGL